MAAQVREMFPQFWGISGSTSTTCSMVRPLAFLWNSVIVIYYLDKFNYIL